MKKVLLPLMLAVMFYGCDYELLPPNKVVSPYLGDLTGYIPKPVSGNSPVKSFETPEFNGTVLWRYKDGFVFGEAKFAEGEAYSAEISLTPKPDFTFRGFQGTFVHRDAKNLSQDVSANPDSAFIVVKFKINDVKIDFIKGSRLKSFLMTPDESLLQNTKLTFSFYRDATSGYNESFFADTEKLSFSVPIRFLFFPQEFSVLGSWYVISSSNYPTGSKTMVIPIAGVNADYNSFEPELFNCDSYILPEKGYTANKNFFEYRQISFPSWSLTPAQFSGITGVTLLSENYNYSFPSGVNFKSVAFDYVLTFRQVSREFYVYENITVSFNTDTPIVGFNKINPVVDRLEFNESENTLTAYLDNYNEKITGIIFCLFVRSEDGAVHTKFISIGEE